MAYDLSEKIVNEIKRIARKNGTEKVVLFGSRARGDNMKRSDVDIAVYGGNFLDFYFDIDENNVTLLFFDVVDMENVTSQELIKEIEKDGVVIYEKNG